MDKRGQEPVDKRQPVLCACADSPFPRPGGEPGSVMLMPQRAISDTSSAITSTDKPVILRSLVIAARDAFPNLDVIVGAETFRKATTASHRSTRHARAAPQHNTTK